MGQNLCSAYPYSYNVYEDLEGAEDPTGINMGSYDCTGRATPYTGAYVLFPPMHWSSPNSVLVQSANPPNCLSTPNTQPNAQLYILQHTELLSFPFTPNLSRTDALPPNTARILTISNEYNHNVNANLQVLSSVKFIDRTNNPADEDAKIPHTIFRHTNNLFCDPDQSYSLSNNESVLVSLPVIVDNTRGRLRYYPYLNENASEAQPFLPAGNQVYDIAIQPFFEFTPSATDFAYINYFPHDKTLAALSNAACEGMASSVIENCIYPQTEAEAMLNPYNYLHPAPYALPGFYIKGNEKATVPAGYTEIAAAPPTGILTKQPGIKHTYIVDKNYDITQVNPRERIFYNPEEVEIEADNLIFPGGYTFATVRGLPPKIDELPTAGQCPEVENLDPRYLPTDTDLPDRTYTFDNGTTVSTKPSVYILKAGSQLTIQPCVYLYGVTFIVKEGATLIYYPNQIYGNYNIIKEDDYWLENNLLEESKVIPIWLHGECNDCRCQQHYDINSDANITTDTEWTEEIKNIRGIVRVTNGAKLVITKSILYFADELITGTPSGIIIEPGAKVIVNHSTLTAHACHNMWNGITIEGNKALPQSPESNQGVLQLNHSIIENARIGVRALQLNFLSNSGGGIIRAYSTTFRNNYFSVQIGWYQPPSASYFHNCLFEQTKLIKGYDADTANEGIFAYAQALLIGSRNVQFKDCTFINRIANNDYTQRGIAILGYLADFYVGKPYGITPTPPAPDALSKKSEIQGYYKAIDTYAPWQWASRATIWRTHFIDNEYGFVGNGTNLDQISESRFYSSQPYWNGKHVFFQHSTNYTVAGNIFQSDNPNEIELPEENGYGIIAHSSGESGSRIFENDFTRLYQGLTIEGNNSHLQLKCNQFSQFAPSLDNEKRYPWYITNITTGTLEPALLGNQGTACLLGKTAGNLFYDEIPDQKHIYAATPVAFRYYAGGTPAETVPQKAGNATLIMIDECELLEADTNTCPALPNLNGFSVGTDLGDALADYIKNNALNEIDLSARTAQATQYLLQQDTTGLQATQFLTAIDTRQAHRMLFSAYVHLSDTAHIQPYNLLVQTDTTLHPQLKEYYKLLHDVIVDNRNIYSLLPQEFTDIEILANSSGAAATYAQSLLAMMRLQTCRRNPQPIGQYKRNDYTDNSQNTLWVFPNPATTYINIAQGLLWEKATLFNLHGQKVASYSYNNYPTLTLPENLKQGIYIVSLQLTSGKSLYAKLLITQ